MRGSGEAVADVGSQRLAEDCAAEFCSRVLTEELWSRLGAQRPLLLPGSAAGLPGRFAAAELLEALARGGGSGAASASKRGKPYERESLFLAYLDEATLSLEGAERFFPVLLELCQGLASSFDYATAELVLDPPACGGRPLAVDSDMLLVQLWGEQRLGIFKPFEAGGPALRPEVLLEPHLRPGDALLLPCGLGCRSLGSAAPAQPRGASLPRGGSAGVPSVQPSAAVVGPSLCAVLRVRGDQQSFAYSLREFFNEVLLKGPFSGDADGFLRSAATKHSLPDRYSGPHCAAPAAEVAARLREELEARLRRCAEEVVPRLGAAGLAEHYEARMEKLRQTQRSSAADVAKAAAESECLVAPGTAVRIARGVACRCVEGSSVASFTRGEATLNLPIAESASRMISRLSDGRPHVVDSLPCDDPVERICVCNVLMFKECLEIAESTEPPSPPP